MRMIHIITKSGQERFTTLGGATDCSGWWSRTRCAGAILGDNWCCPFDEIAFAEVVETNVADEQKPILQTMTPFRPFGEPQ